MNLVSILLSSSLNLVSIFAFKLFSTESILLSSSVFTKITSDFKLRSNISSLRLKLLSKYSISL
ncbi:hypothetical protein bpuSUM_001962 (plasmid) [Borrelia puertoricensis]|nr:hypothetical protein bpuSUM_001789 [Borrelia puertoricensis]UPA19344.1 hypothetical protein bpuSUM_001962 [Borrelia puertoricensis]